MPREVQPIAAVQAPAVINIYRIFLIALCNVTCLRASRVVVSLLAYSLFLGAATYLLFPFFTDVTVLTAIAFMRGLSLGLRPAAFVDDGLCALATRAIGRSAGIAADDQQLHPYRGAAGIRVVGLDVWSGAGILDQCIDAGGWRGGESRRACIIPIFTWRVFNEDRRNR